MPPPKTIVIGIDGGNFELVEKWIASGELPNIAKIVRQGITGEMRSVLPPVTSPNWKAYTTGKNPGKLGIFWWENIDTANKKVYYPTHRKNASTEFFELIAEQEPVGILGIPTTFPPKHLDEFVISGAPDAEEEGFAYPSSLEQRLKDEFGYYVGLKASLKHEADEAAAEIQDLIDLRFEVAKTLLEETEVSFLQATTFYINSMHHYFWDGERTLAGWKVIDDHIADFLDANYNVILMSDHGSNRIETVFNINTWLHREGYLALPDRTVENVFKRLGITRNRMASILHQFGLREMVKRLLPFAVRKRIPEREGQISRERGTWFDWDRTDVVATSQGPVYLNVDPSSPKYDRLLMEIIEKLKRLTDPGGNPITDAVHQIEEVYSGEYMNEAPDIIIDQASHIHISGDAGRSSIFVDPEDDGWKGENKREALFAAMGPTFGTGHIDELSILDLAPTLLHLHDVEIPEDMDGTVRKELFSPGTEPRDRDVVYQKMPKTTNEIKRIREVAQSLDL